MVLRALSDALQSRSPERLRAQLDEVLAGDTRDDRDVMVAMAPILHCARQLGVDAEELFDQAAAAGPEHVADLVRGFARRTDVTPGAFGFYFIRSGPDSPRYEFDGVDPDEFTEWMRRQGRG